MILILTLYHGHIIDEASGVLPLEEIIIIKNFKLYMKEQKMVFTFFSLSLNKKCNGHL